MTPREQIEKAMKESVAETIYAMGWGITPQATDLLECAYTKGAEYGYNLALEKALEWFKKNWRNYVAQDRDGVIGLIGWQWDFKEDLKL